MARVTRLLARVLVLVLLAGAPPAVADPETLYFPEFVCVAVMERPGVPAQSCTRSIASGEWHIDVDAAWGMVGTFGARVEVPEGRYLEKHCERDVLGGSTSCSATFGGLGDETGSDIWFADGSIYLHVALPEPGSVTFIGGAGTGVLVGRGSRP